MGKEGPPVCSQVSKDLMWFKFLVICYTSCFSKQVTVDAASEVHFKWRSEGRRKCEVLILMAGHLPIGYFTCRMRWIKAFLLQIDSQLVPEGFASFVSHHHFPRKLNFSDPVFFEHFL